MKSLFITCIHIDIFTINYAIEQYLMILIQPLKEWVRVKVEGWAVVVQLILFTELV